MPDDHFGEDVAASYDDDVAEMFADDVVGPAVDVLAELADGGPALELGIGTGRIALPLASRGVPVHGIELSEAMAARLRAKPGAEQIGVTIGDLATIRVDGRFSLVYLVFNTIMNLTSQDEQLACFRNAADHLRPDGWFLIETMVPELRRLPPGEHVRPFEIGTDRLGFDDYDAATQSLVSHHFWRTDDGWASSSTPFRYVWPAELDLMATIAGLRLRHRWDDWHRAPFTHESRRHVSVWQLEPS